MGPKKSGKRVFGFLLKKSSAIVHVLRSVVKNEAYLIVNWQLKGEPRQ